MTDTVNLTIAEGEALLERAFAATGVAADAAASVASALVAAEAEGQVGHGFSRVADYAAQARSGKVNCAAHVTTRARGTASFLTDADCGFAYPALDAARSAGLSAAEEAGVAVMAVTNSHHCGALSVQVDRIARTGLIGIMVANTPKAIAPWGAREALFGTNPIAFAVPRHGAEPLVIDLSLSVAARGKVMAAQKAGKRIPEGWALDATGQPTTNPEAALAGTMVPIGEAKGTALALMVEVLAAVFTGAAFSSEASSFFAAGGPAPRVGQTMIAIRPGHGGDFATRLEMLLDQIEALDGARLPGTRRLAALARARAEGLSVPMQHVEVAERLAAGG
ncbi:MAG: Ldh family oxidoreductase [Pseudomonadota bacterium]